MKCKKCGKSINKSEINYITPCNSHTLVTEKSCSIKKPHCPFCNKPLWTRDEIGNIIFG